MITNPITRAQRLQQDMLILAERERKKTTRMRIIKARKVEIPTEDDLLYWKENSKTFLGYED